MSARVFNLTTELESFARETPERLAVALPEGKTRDGRLRWQIFSFKQLNERVDRYAHGLSRQGILRGQRVLLMLRPGADLISVTFALMKVGAIPVLIDPGMGRKAFLQCIAEARPEAMIGIPAAFLAKGWYRSSFSSIRTVILAGRLALPGAIAMHHCLSPTDHPFPAAKTLENEDAAVAFTSGSTGSPKGVVFQHGQFRAQLASMRQNLGIKPGDIHLAAMYIFALFDPALGVSTVIPEMDPRHTAKVDPQGLVEAIESFGVTMMLGAPTVFKRLLSCPKLQPAQLATLKKLFLFGAPVYPPLLQRLKAVMPDALISTPYGATEALPLTLVNAGELASLSTLGQGVCVGTPVPGVALQIIEWSTEVIPVWAKAKVLPQGVIGEVVVSGAVVTERYLNRPMSNQQAKIADNGTIWHRMGDMGYLDEDGRLWLVGRASHVLHTPQGPLYPLQHEPLFDQVPQIRRSALVGLGPRGEEEPLLLVELEEGASWSEVQEALKQQVLRHPQSAVIRRFVRHPGFPLDVRHNAKIRRELLKSWAEERFL